MPSVGLLHATRGHPALLSSKFCADIVDANPLETCRNCNKPAGVHANSRHSSKARPITSVTSEPSRVHSARLGEQITSARAPECSSGRTNHQRQNRTNHQRQNARLGEQITQKYQTLYKSRCSTRHVQSPRPTVRTQHDSTRQVSTRRAPHGHPPHHRGHLPAREVRENRREKAADAASALQAALRRHRIQRCEDPAHQGRVTYARRPVPCFEAAHAHPGRVVCTRNRQGYLEQARTRLSGTAMVQTRGGGAALSPPGTSGGGVDSM